MTDPLVLLSQLHGDGRVTYRALAEAGFDTLEAIAASEVEALAERARVSDGTARRLRDGAREMLAETRVEVLPPPRGGEPSGERVAGRTTARVAAAFSEGIVMEEATLLGQGIEIRQPLPRPPRESGFQPGAHDIFGAREEIRGASPSRQGPAGGTPTPAARGAQEAAAGARREAASDGAGRPEPREASAEAQRATIAAAAKAAEALWRSARPAEPAPAQEPPGPPHGEDPPEPPPRRSWHFG